MSSSAKRPSRGLNLIRRGGVTIDGDSADQKRREHIISPIIAKNNNAPPCGRDTNMISGGHAQLAAIGQVNRKWNERSGVGKFSNVRSHTAGKYRNPCAPGEQRATRLFAQPNTD